MAVDAPEVRPGCRLPAAVTQAEREIPADGNDDEHDDEQSEHSAPAQRWVGYRLGGAIVTIRFAATLRIVFTAPPG